MYKQCCVPGTGQLLKNHDVKPPDIIVCHIFPHSYHDVVGIFLHLLVR